MKILIGICGIGNGHINRQICVIEELLIQEVSIVVAITKEKEHILTTKFPQIKTVVVNIPWITCNNEGIDYYDSLEKYKLNGINQYESFLKFCISVEDEFGGKPNLVISDYEPNVAQYAYSASIPLICMEQQSKFLYIPEENIENHSIREEKYRLNYFFPKYKKRIISSFFPISVKNSDVVITSPIIPDLKKKTTILNKIVVYFSPYSDSKKYQIILDIIKEINEYSFIVYTSQNIEEYQECKNIKFFDFNDDFKEDLCSARALLTTGGHQLISEAISLNIPMYVFPLDTYEQKYNSLMVEKYDLGVVAKKYSVNELRSFLDRCDFYCNNIIAFKNRYYIINWKKEIRKFLKEIEESNYEIL